MTAVFSAALEVCAEQQNKVTPKLVSHAASVGGRQRTQAAGLQETFLCPTLPCHPTMQEGYQTSAVPG